MHYRPFVTGVVTLTATALSAITIGLTSTPNAAAAQANAAGAATRAAGAPSIMDEFTTETTQVTNNNDGTFTLTSNREPVRAKTSTGWKPLDLTLRADSAGRIAPAVAANPVSFSPGGDTPAAIFGQGSTALSFSLPTTLPRPDLDGPTATYTNIYPGVDLKLTATPIGYSDVLVIHNAAAATDPRVTAMHWSLTAPGRTLTTHPDGSITTPDTTSDSSPDRGASVTNSTDTNPGTISTGTPVMWDSTPGTFGPTPSATNTGTGTTSTIPTTVTVTNSADSDTITTSPANRTTSSPGPSSPKSSSTTPMTASTNMTMALTPNPAALTGPGVTYPIYIDPAMTANKVHTLTVSSGGVQAYDSSTRKLQVGWCNWAGCGSLGTARSFFTLDTRALSGKPTTAKIIRASVTARQVWTAASAPTAVNLRGSAGFSSTTTWPGPSMNTVLGTISSAAGFNGTNPGEITFTGATVTNYFQNAANLDWTNATLALQAPNEGDAYQWKQFDTNPAAAVTFSFPPNTPTGLGIGSPIACPGKPVYARDTMPWMVATATSNNPADNGFGISYRIARKNPTDPTPVFAKSTTTTVLGTSGTPIWWNPYQGTNTTSTGPLYNATWQLEARADTNNDTLLSSPWSAPYYFNVDTQAPTSPTATIQADGTITLTSPGAAGFILSTSSTLPTLATTDCTYNGSRPNGTKPTATLLKASNGTATFTPTTGPNNLYIQAFDDAHNMSCYTAGNCPLKVDPTA
ncbi:hypothetical protein [Calidifontibacter indicus]|uniref:hypothetical protein n=1 Tax=Calidifontibacter indicus TaxID=419650 RepID=UPI003D70C1E1